MDLTGVTCQTCGDIILVHDGWLMIWSREIDMFSIRFWALLSACRSLIPTRCHWTNCEGMYPKRSYDNLMFGLVWSSDDSDLWPNICNHYFWKKMKVTLSSWGYFPFPGPFPGQWLRVKTLRECGPPPLVRNSMSSSAEVRTSWFNWSSK